MVGTEYANFTTSREDHSSTIQELRSHHIQSNQVLRSCESENMTSIRKEARGSECKQEHVCGRCDGDRQRTQDRPYSITSVVSTALSGEVEKVRTRGC